MSVCHFCEKQLPEPPAQHTIYAAGQLHNIKAEGEEPLPLYPVCFACMKRMKLQPRELRREVP